MSPPTQMCTRLCRSFAGFHPSTRLRNPLELRFHGAVSYGSVVSTAAVEAFFGSDGFEMPETPMPRVRWSARFTCASMPALFDASRIGNAASVNGPGADDARPMQSSFQTFDVNCAAFDNCPSAAQSQ